MLTLPPLFVEVIKSKAKSGKIYEPFLVRESIRTPDGPRSRTVCNISGLPPQTRDLVAHSLNGLTLVSPLSASLHHALDYGGLAVLREAWTRFGLPEFFGTIPEEAAARLQAIIFSRLLFPCARLPSPIRHGAPSWPQPAACRLRKNLMKTISTLRWISSPDAGLRL